ncbi:hypothetical protein [Polynucleobacter necessarius]|uniref:arsenate reductase/protein-tyrosine-phosphatase family protein n=1 Tax=Polynucleobacter necessarius TaxID=576610 RepID=UPI002F947D6D
MKQYNILFLCTHNSARSVLAESLASTYPSGKLVGYSAGSMPGSAINPIAEQLALELGMDPAKLWSKSWYVFAQPNVPKMDFIITACDNAAGGESVQYHLVILLLHIGAFLILHKYRAQR